jgi:hypothetical protein
MYELYAVTVKEAMVLLLLLGAHGALIGLLVRRGWLAAPRPTRASLSALPGPRTITPPERHERMAA